MKKPLILVTVLLVCLALCAPVFAEPPGSPTREVVVFHTNDVHARATSADGMGYAMAAGYVNAERAAGSNVLLLDAGDTFHGLPFATAVRGESIVDILNAMGYDAMAPGNHDYNYGMDRLFELKDMLSFPMLCCNLVDAEGKPAMQPYTIKEFDDGTRVGIIGADNPEIAIALRPETFETYHLDDGIAAIKAAVAELEDQTDAIIVLCHWGTEGVDHPSDEVARIEGVDLVVDGHSHSTFPNGYRPEGGCPIVSTGTQLENLGKATLLIDGGKVTGVEVALIPKPQVFEDENILKTIETIAEEQAPILNEVVGHTDVLLEGTREIVRTGESNLADLICDAMIAQTGADIALTNGGGIRASIEAGDITRGDVIKVLPFGNYVVTKRVKGADIRAAFEYGLRMYPEQLGGFPQVGGARFTFDPAKEEGGRIAEFTVGGQPLDDEKEYLLATNDYMAEGGDGYEMLMGYPVETAYGGLDEILLSYIETLETIPAEPDGRIAVAG